MYSFTEQLKNYTRQTEIEKKEKSTVAIEIILPFIMTFITIQFFLAGDYRYFKFLSIPIILAMIIFNQKRLHIPASLQGFKPPFWKAPALIILIPALLLGICIVFFGYLQNSISTRIPIPLILHIAFIGYPIWGMIQQYVLIVYLLPRLNVFIKKPAYLVIITASVFSLSHLPNPFLVILTFPAGILFIYFFIRYKNLYILGFAHGFIGALGKFFLPETLTLRFWIGNLISYSDFINYFK